MRGLYKVTMRDYQRNGMRGMSNIVLDTLININHERNYALIGQVKSFRPLLTSLY